jgi:hypothetical protein
MSLSNFRTGPMGPAVHVYVITPHETDPLPAPVKGIRAGAAGTITFRALDSTDDVAHPVVAGEIIPAVITHVRLTGTDAGVLIGYA